MRTTLNIDDEALAEVKKYAEQRSISLGEAATSLICRGVASLPNFKTKNGWVIFDSVPGAPPLTIETVTQLAEDDLNEEVQRAFSRRR
jgi:hypothetical protein